MNIPYVFKKCTKCGEWLVANNYNFTKSKIHKWNLFCMCKKCKKEYNKEYYENNKDKINKYSKEYREKNEDKIKEYNKEYYENNKDKIKKYNKEHQKEYRKNNKDKILEYNKQWHKNNPEKLFNKHNRRRSKLENQGRGINKEQYKECNEWFDWKCAYSGELLKNTKDTYGRTLDHIVAIDNGGLNEPWNVIPMRKGYNSSKKDKVNSLDWYMGQEYFDIERLNKIVEWQIYAYEKWGEEEFGELILITDLLEEVKNYE